MIYSHRRPAPGTDGKDYVDLPFIVTRVLHDGVSIDGVVFDGTLVQAAGGSKAVRSAPKGEGGGTWRFR